jgi:tetratricopeptide (TPR) repeat protein
MTPMKPMNKCLAGLLVLLLLAHDRPAAASEGYQLYAQERYAEAEAAFARSGGDAITHAATLIRLERLAEAQRLVDDPDPRLALMHGAAAFAAAGEIGRASALLDAGIAQWPADADLLSRRGAVEMQAKRPLKAMAYLARVVELVPADPGARLALVRCLAVAGMPVRLHQAVEAVRTAGMAVGPEMMDADLDALQSFGDHRKVVAEAERYLDQGGVATATILTRLAISLEAVGSKTRAAERRKAAESLRPSRGQGRRALPLAGDQSREAARAAIDRSDWSAAVSALGEWAAVRPDDPEMLAQLQRPEIAERLGWATVFAQINRMVERDPLDPSRRLLAVQAHARPPGSSILALIHAHGLSRSGEAGDPQVRAGQTLREAVQARLEQMGRVAELDIERSTIRILPPDGPALVVQVHPATGRMIRFAEGFDHIEATWDVTGTRLLSMIDSRGARVQLDWRDGRLAGLRREGRFPFSVQLASDGRPLRAEGEAVADIFNVTLEAIKLWQRADIAEARRVRLGN